MFWNPSVNLLVRIRVGGVSFVGIVFMNEGIVPPLSLFHMKKKKGKSYHPRALSTNLGGLLWQGPVQGHMGKYWSPPAKSSSIAGATGGTEQSSWRGETGHTWGLWSYRKKNLARLMVGSGECNKNKPKYCHSGILVYSSLYFIFIR